MDLAFTGYCYAGISFGLIYLAFHLANKRHLLQSKRYWYTAAFLYNLLSISFITNAYPLVWFAHPVLQFFAFIVFLALSALVTALPYTFVSFFFQKVTSRLCRIIFIGPLFFCIDVARSATLSLLLWGKEANIGLHFIVGSLGQGLTYTPFVSLAYYGGIFLLSGIIAYIAYIFTTEKFCRAILLSIPILLWYMALQYAPIHSPQKSMALGIVTTNEDDPASGKFVEDYTRRYKEIETIFQNTREQHDLIVFPESTNFLLVWENATSTQKIPGTFVLDGVTIIINNHPANTSLLYSTLDENSVGNTKSYLMPISEYLPYIIKLPLRLVLGQDDYNNYIANHTYTPAKPGSNTIFEVKGNRITTLLCSEGTSYSGVHAAAKNNPDLIIMQSNLAVFKDRLLGKLALYGYSRLAAATNRTSLLSVNNKAPSFMIGPSGKVLTTFNPSLALHTIHIEPGDFFKQK